MHSYDMAGVKHDRYPCIKEFLEHVYDIGLVHPAKFSPLRRAKNANGCESSRENCGRQRDCVDESRAKGPHHVNDIRRGSNVATNIAECFAYSEKISVFR